MLTRDRYIALLEKRASYDGTNPLTESIPYNDSAQYAKQEHDANMSDSRADLKNYFNRADDIERNNTSEVRKLFDMPGKDIRVNHPLMKVARDVFFDALSRQGNFMKTATPIHLELAYKSFTDELEKIAAHKQAAAPRIFGGGGMAPARPALANRAARMASSPAAAAGSGTTLNQSPRVGSGTTLNPPFKPQGSGTSVHSGGFMSRLLGKTANLAPMGGGAPKMPTMKPAAGGVGNSPSGALPQSPTLS